MKIRTLCALLLTIPSIAMAFGVNTKNGNFYVSYQDITQTHDLDIKRTYNSKAIEVGWFGFGWGSRFETHLMVMPDLSVVVHEEGAGREIYYSPKDGTGLQAGVDKIVAVATERHQLDHDAAEALRNNLLHDENLRSTTVAKYGIQTQLPVGGIAKSSCGDVVTRINDEYRRTRCESGNDFFDLSGRLLRKEEADGYKVTLHYAGKYPDRIEDSLGQKLYLSWTAAGHVAKAWTDKPAPIVVYHYDANDNLLMSNELGGNFYRYEYDGNHDLTRVGNIDHTHMDMQYNENSVITSLTDADGSKTTYSYRMDPKNPSSHYWTTITSIAATGAQSSREEEFSLGADAAGVEHIAGVTSTDGQRKKEVMMDDQGRIKYVRNPDGGFSEFFYHPTLDKIRAVVTDNGSVVFTYDKAGNLIRAYNTQDQLIKLGYDSKNHITSMVETNKTNHTRNELTFKYNALGKPIRIKMIGKGEIDVEYDAQGEVSKAESRQGVKIALEVSNAFQVLLKVVKVAGVDFGM